MAITGKMGNSYWTQFSDFPRCEDMNTKVESLESVEISFSRGLQDLKLKQSLVLFFLGLHLVVAYALFGWGSKFYIQHDFQNRYFYVSLGIYGFNLVTLLYFNCLKDRFTSTKKTKNKLLAINYIFCLLVFLDGNLVYCTEPVFLLVGVCVFTIRISQILTFKHVTNTVEVCSDTHLVQSACKQPSTKRNKVLVALFDLRRTNLRSVVVWSLLALSYNFLSNLWCLVRTPSHNLSYTNVQTIINQHANFSSNLEFPQEKKISVQPLLWNQKRVPRPVVLSPTHNCSSLPVVFTQPISRENNLKAIGGCNSQGALNNFKEDFGFGHGFNILSRENTYFMGTDKPSNQCAQKKWQPPCDDHQCSQREILVTDPNTLYWYVPVSSPTRKSWRDKDAEVWYIEQDQEMSGIGWGWICGEEIRTHDPQIAPAAQPLEWVSASLLFWSEQSQISPYDPNRSKKLLLTATHAAFFFPQLIHYKHDVFLLSGILYAKEQQDCAQRTEFWCLLLEALRILHSETFFLERDLLHIQDQGCKATKHTNCTQQWRETRRKVEETKENWQKILNQMSIDVWFRNIILTLYMGIILLLKAYELLRKYILVGYRPDLQIKHKTLVISISKKNLTKTTPTDPALYDAMYVLRSLNKNVGWTVLGSFIFVLFTSMAIISASTQFYNTANSFFPTYGWILHARVLLNGETYYREPFLYIFLLLVLSFLTASILYLFYSTFIRPLFFLLFWHQLKVKLQSPQKRKYLKKYVWSLYLRTTALFEGLYINIAIVLGWVSQSWYTSPWPWKYTPWYFVSPQTWNMTFFINCIFLPIVSVFAVNYFVECSLRETRFWSRIQDTDLVLEGKIKKEEIETLLNLEEEDQTLHIWFSENHSNSSGDRCLEANSLAWRSHSLDPRAEEFIANLLIAHTLHLQFGDHIYHGKHSLFTHNFVKNHLQGFESIHKKQIAHRSYNLQTILDAREKEYQQIQNLKNISSSKLVSHFFNI